MTGYTLRLRFQISNSQTVIASVSEAIHKATRVDCFRLRSLSFDGRVVASLLAMTSRYANAFSRRDASELCRNHSPREFRGRRECRAHDAPAASRAKQKSTRVSHHGHTGIARHSPRNGFNGFLRALPGDRACLPPSPAKVAFRRLDASVGASGPHDFAVRIRRASSLRTISVHRIPPPTSVTIAKRPSRGGGTESIYFCFYPGVKRNF